MKEIQVIKEDSRKKITLVRDEQTSRTYIQRRIYEDKREVYNTLQKISHPNIPKIINVEFDCDTVVTEEYVNGTPLSQLVDSNTRFTKKQIRSIAYQLISAISELHKLNIIHRDIKPDNIIINDSGHIWLIDYDIARIYRDEMRKDTESMGTFGYAPIEQYGVLPTDYKTDIYAFGKTLLQLLERSNIKGYLYRIAQKCTRLDPSQRYLNAKKLRNAIRFRALRNPLPYAAVLVLIGAGCIGSWKYNSAVEYDFIGFEDYPKYIEYSAHENFSDCVIFSTDVPWEHLLFLDDVNMNGRIKLGEKDTLVKADITLDDGELTVELNDRRGNSFEHTFKFENQYRYTKRYTDDLRKNADIVRSDLDSDNVPELLIGLNEAAVRSSDTFFFCGSNYAVAWVVKYDEESGFTLCDGDMFAKRGDFYLTDNAHEISVYWEFLGDPFGYVLEGNRIVSY